MRWKLRYLRSTKQLRLASAAWDDLWRRGTSPLPVHRAELVAQWVEAFHASDDLRAVVVESDGQFVAALPLVADRLRKLLPIGRLTGNDWSPAGDLLWDPEAGTEPLDVLVRGLQGFPWAISWLEGIPLTGKHWQEFTRSLERARVPVLAHVQSHVGVVDCAGEWDAFERRWSSNHRRQLRKAAQRAIAEGGVSLRVIREFRSLDEVADLVHRGFVVEDRSWKGTQANSSVLKSPGMLDYYVRQAQCLAEMGHLQLTFLEFANQPIAFEYGWHSRGVYYTPKVGYDESFARFSPGQLLRRELFEQIFDEREIERIDFTGELCAATAKWTTGSYPVGRLVIGSGSYLSRILMQGYRAIRYHRAFPDEARQGFSTVAVGEPAKSEMAEWAVEEERA